jgi:hypothetical protein
MLDDLHKNCKASKFNEHRSVYREIYSVEIARQKRGKNINTPIPGVEPGSAR